jgi:hypothetical protein
VIEGIEYLIVAGEGEKYITVIIDPTEKLRKTKDHEELEFYFLKEFERIKHQLPTGQKPAKVHIVNPFAIETMELTHNLKLRRKFILEKYTKR